MVEQYERSRRNVERNIETNLNLHDELSDIALWETLPVITLDRIMAAATTHMDKAVGHTVLTDHTESQFPPLGNDLQALGQWPSVVTTLWNKVTTMTHLDVTTEDMDPATFAAFKTKWASCPFWNGLDLTFTQSKFTLNEVDYRPAVRAIIGLITSVVTGSSLPDFILNVRQVAEMASKRGQATEKKSTFSNGSVTTFRGGLHAWFCYCHINMERRATKYHVSLNQEYKVVVGRGLLDFDFCKRHADRILAFEPKIIDDWVEEPAANQEPPNESDGWIDV